MKYHKRRAMPTATKTDVIGRFSVCLAAFRRLIWAISLFVSEVNSYIHILLDELETKSQ